MAYTLSGGPPARAAQTPRPGLALTVKPLRGAAGVVTQLDVTEVLSAGPLQDGAPLQLALPLLLNGSHLAERVNDLLVSDAAGAVPLDVSDDAPSAEDDYRYRRWRATRATVLPVSIRYRIGTQPIAEGGPPYGMKASGAGVAGNGLGFLLLPENTASAATSLHWDLSDLPAGSLGVTTIGKGDVIVPGAPAQMTDQWMLAGPAMVLDSVRTPGFHAYLLGQPPFDAKTALDWSDRAYAYLASSLKYLGAPDYNLFFRVLDGPSYGTGTARMDGGGALMSFGERYSDGQDWAVAQNFIFHEMTHQWVGKFDSDGPWFVEGLTTYFSAVLPCRAGLMPAAVCARGVNEWVRNYYGSEARNWSLRKIAGVTDNESIRRIPYARGMLYFAQLDARLRARSHGRKGLEDLLAPLFLARQRGLLLNDAVWETLLRRELGQQAVTQFRREVVNGTQTIVPPSPAFGPCLQRTRVTWRSESTHQRVSAYEWTPRCGPVH